MADRYASGVFCPRDIELVCFDGDGTMWNTEEDLLFPIHSEMLAARGHVLTEGQYRKIIGLEALQAATIMVETFHLNDTPEAYMLERRARARSRWPQVQLMPGAEQVLRKLRVSRVPLAMVSAATREHVEAIAEARNVRQYFQLLVTEETTGRTKPHPDPYVAAAKRFRAKPHKCLAFEDTAHGAKSAYDAGMIVVGVANHRFASRTELAKVVHYVLPEGQNIGDFELKDIAHLLPP